MSCPNCGYCPHCGRSGLPHYGQPYAPLPTWPNPNTTPWFWGSTDAIPLAFGDPGSTSYGGTAT